MYRRNPRERNCHVLPTKPMMGGAKVQEIQQALMRLGLTLTGPMASLGPTRKPR
jgi:hypothetical protein